MHIQERIQAMVSLGKWIAQLDEAKLQLLQQQVKNNNSWFTEENVQKAIFGILKMLDPDNLHTWVKMYPQFDTPLEHVKKVGVVMAGNIPAVGFHDFLCVLMSGHTLYVKLSSEDNILIKLLAEILIKFEPRFEEKIHFVEKINEVDAVIATGSDNTSRYFEFYFASKPHIIRQNRVSIAVLNGEETFEELQELGKDIFTYFGLGCRNVSKLYVPENYDFTKFMEAMEPYNPVAHHSKYFNNYEYNKAIYLIKPVEHLDNGFLLLTQSKELASPVAVLHYEFYDTIEEVEIQRILFSEKIQCVVSNKGWLAESIAFGETQKPDLWDYADGIDIMEFLFSLSH